MHLRIITDQVLASALKDMLDKSQLLGLTAPEMTVLIGGMRSLGITASDYGLISENTDELSNDYFKTLLDMKSSGNPTVLKLL